MECHPVELSTFEISLKLNFLMKQNIFHLQGTLVHKILNLSTSHIQNNC